MHSLNAFFLSNADFCARGAADASVLTLQFVDKLDIDRTEAVVPAVRERSRRRPATRRSSRRRQSRRRASSRRSRGKSARRRKLRGRVRRAYYGNGKQYALI